MRSDKQVRLVNLDEPLGEGNPGSMSVGNDGTGKTAEQPRFRPVASIDVMVFWRRLA